ncbi:helix-turn-helix transcriptional regulator [Kineosporia babensis]|uniref:AAA family ATPase n=1 Tax=Kineosporia babensis TaxID=499548 RepID=A0A9X1SX51_9ACTN|nr:LuxR family transcriptional regulator [Kineosporia babensis]MCD5314785.1 AAA family ATPase [Kineosporia babensis]
MTVERLVGREEILQRILALHQESALSGGTILLIGEAGIGKTLLLQHAAMRTIETGGCVLRVEGAEFEADVSYSALNQLFLPLLDEIAELTATHAEALRVALGFGTGPAPDRLLVSNAALLLLRRVAADGPLLILVDDLPWVDRASALVLGFVARRLAGSRIGFVAASRTGLGSFFDDSGLPRLDLGPLSFEDAENLIKQHFPEMAVNVRQRLLSESRGNPLALVEFPNALSDQQRQAQIGLPAVLPLTERLRSLFASRVDDLPADCRRLLLLAALDRSGGSATLRSAGGELAALAPAERDRLVYAGQSIEFRHPLIRSAVVEGSTISERRTAHRRLADALVDQPDRRAWHLGEASTGPDEEVAGLLEEAAGRAQRRGDATGAVSSLARAADLSPEPADRGRRLAQAAYLGADSVGEMLGATHLLDRARRSSPDVGASLPAAAATAMLLINDDGDVLTAYQLLMSAVEMNGAENDSALSEALYTLLLLSWYSGREEVWARVFAVIDELKPEPPQVLAIARHTFPDPARTGQKAAAELDALLADPPVEPVDSDLMQLGTASVYLDRLAGLRERNWKVVRAGRQGRVPARRRIAALTHLGHDSFHAGRWAELEQLAAEGSRLCDEYGYRFFVWHFRYLSSMHAAATGEHEASQELTDTMNRWAVRRNALGVRWFAAHPRTLNHLGQGDYEAAYREATVFSSPGTIASHVPQALWIALDLVEAAWRSGRHEEARSHAAAMRTSDLAGLSSRLALHVATARAWVATDEEVRRRFDEALALPGISAWPFDLARSRLAYGERLRRLKRTAEARAQLASAESIFERLGARPWLERTQSELRATGFHRPRAVLGPRLTPKEREIADLAGAGLTNKQIGERLYLSHRTVSTHLYQIFPKLGISSRAALRDALNGWDREEPV